MIIITPIKRFLIKQAVARLYLFGFTQMRKDPEATKKKMAASGQSAEGLDEILAMPDFVIKRLAESMAEVLVADPNMGKILKGEAQIESAKVTKRLATKQDVVRWFAKTGLEGSTNKLSEKQLKRDGAHLLCQKGSGYFEKGMFSQAQTFFSRAVEVDEGYADAWSGLSDTLKAIGNDAEAANASARANALRAREA